MKKIIMIVGTLLLSAGCLTAQDSPTQDTATHGYRSFFGSESTVWNCGMILYDLGPDDNRVVIGRDTVVGAVHYRVISSNWGTGLIREDSVSGKMWVKGTHWSDQEELIADLSLSIGDSFDIGYRGWYVVDSVYYDSVGRKTIHLTHNNYPDFYMKEEVGAEMLWPVFFNPHYETFLICVHHNDTLLYKTTVEDGYNYLNRDSCRVRLHESINEIMSERINIYPNPCYNYIKVDDNKLKCVQIYDQKGVLIAEASNSIVDMTGTPSGLYVIVAITDDKIIYKKIIKK